ncbi:hypothetical protein K438DRAFT_694145 [Mycena galopus ATCC 62051]|nr:hypothetical protein K438DRAFT_694145 [Mycena galopus ATCC 62051]
MMTGALSSCLPCLWRRRFPFVWLTVLRGMYAPSHDYYGSSIHDPSDGHGGPQYARAQPPLFPSRMAENDADASGNWDPDRAHGRCGDKS